MARFSKPLFIVLYDNNTLKLFTNLNQASTARVRLAWMGGLHRNIFLSLNFAINKLIDHKVLRFFRIWF
jgi:hypothetical protein